MISKLNFNEPNHINTCMQQKKKNRLSCELKLIDKIDLILFI